MSKTRITTTAIAASLLTLALTSTPALALQCPMPQETASPGVLKQTKEDIARLDSQLQKGTAGNAVSEIVFNLKKQYPNATSEEVVNYMLTAYCPVVAREKSLSEDQIRAKLENFVIQVRKIYAN